MKEKISPEEDQKWLVVDEALLIFAKDSKDRYLLESPATKIIDHNISLLEKLIKARKVRLSKSQDILP